MSIVSGNGGLLLAQAMGRGADGIMTGFCVSRDAGAQVFEAGMCGATPMPPRTCTIRTSPW